MQQEKISTKSIFSPDTCNELSSELQKQQHFGAFIPRPGTRGLELLVNKTWQVSDSKVFLTEQELQNFPLLFFPEGRKGRISSENKSFPI